VFKRERGGSGVEQKKTRDRGGLAQPSGGPGDPTGDLKSSGGEGSRGFVLGKSEELKF